MTQVDPKGTSVLRRAAMRVGAVLATATTLGLAAAIVILGQNFLAERASAVGTPEPAPLVSVATQPLIIEDGFETLRRFPGQVQAGQRTSMAFEAGGAVAEIFVDEGDRIEAGALVARLDIRLLEAERDRLRASRAAMEAQAELARRTSDRRAALRDRGHASSQSLDDITMRLTEANARIAEVDASLAAIEVRIDKSVLTAPFSADVAERMIDDGAMASPGAPVLTLVEAGVRRFRVGLSPEVVAELSTDRVYEARFGARRFPVTLSTILPELDPMTRTRTVLFDFFPGDTPSLRATGELSLPAITSATGAWAPVSALRDGPQGLWLLTTVRQNPEGSVAAVEAVEVIHSESDRVFVRGTFRDGDLVVTDGTHRIAPGQTVRPLADDPVRLDLVASAREAN